MSKARELLSLCEMQDILVKDGKRIYMPKKPYYSNMPSSKFDDMTERELNALIHKVITKPDVHYNLSALFTDEQLNTLMASDTYKSFSRSTQDSIDRAFGEAVETFIEVDGQRLTIDEFKELIGAKSSVTASLQDLVDEYNKKTKRDAKIVLYKNGKKVFK